MKRGRQSLRALCSLPTMLLLARGAAAQAPLPSSGTGEAIYFSSTPARGSSRLIVMDPDGGALRELPQPKGDNYSPVPSPDGKRIAWYVHSGDAAWSIFVMDRDGGNVSRLSDLPGVCDCMPSWSPDGKSICFSRWYPLEGYRSELWLMDSDGRNQRRIAESDSSGAEWSPDGKTLVFHSNMGSGRQICTSKPDGSGLARLTSAGTENYWPAFSPDGDKIAFQSNRDGNHEIYVMGSDGSDQRRLTFDGAEDGDPCWSPDGRRIAFSSYRDGKYEIYSMNADGSGQSRLTTLRLHNISPCWRKNGE